MKTAMQQLLDKLTEMQKDKGVGYWVLDAVKEHMPIEREQIEEAWFQGTSNMEHIAARDYFTSTYPTK